MNVVFSLSLPRVNSEFAIRFPISENVSIMRNFPAVHHFGKLTVNEGFCAVCFPAEFNPKRIFMYFNMHYSPLNY